MKFFMHFGQNPLTKPKEYYWQAFGIAMLVAACFFVPYIILDQGYFLFYGDFNVQQVPFYKLAHEAIRSGNWYWDFGTDLGTNFIGSYSFYLLGSPFFWLTMPFPTDFLPYLMGPLLILKFSCASLTAYCYLRRFVKNKQFALLGGLLYAFSGFSVYNIFFNHFHEAIVLFPLLLLALEMLMIENRRGFFLFMVTLCAVANYFFFVGMVVFLFLYYIVRVLSGGWKVSTAKFFQVALESLLGVGLGAILLLPSALMVMQNSRVNSFPLGWGGILYGRNQITAYIFQCFFFPPELPARPTFFTGADVKWSSVAGWMPVFGMVGVIGWLQAKKGHWLRRLICILGFMAFVPILNSAFYAFNYAYYARWFYMPILMMALATCIGLEDQEINWASGFRWTAGITLAIIGVVGFFPTSLKGEIKFENFGLYDKKLAEIFWVTCAIAVVGLIVMFVLLQLRKKSVKIFTRTAIISVCAVSVLYSAFFLGAGKSYSYDTKNYIIPSLLESEIQLEDQPISELDDFRIDTYKCMDNVAMFLGVSGIQAFHSIVPNSIFEFYEFVGVDRVVGSRPDAENYPLRSFLSVKYTFDHTSDNNNDSNRFGMEDEFGSYATQPGWSDSPISTQYGFDIYENEAFIPYGFTYDYYMTEAYAEEYTNKERQFLLLEAMLLDDKQIERHSDILQDINTKKVTSPLYDSHGVPIEKDELYVPLMDKTAYLANSRERALHSADSFETDSRGFTSTIDLDRENLVFYSIPYDEGWSATVDGEPVEIEKVNVGFMAVRVPAGEHTIRFDYETPGLTMGIWITLGCAGVALLYLFITFLYYHFKKQNDLIDEALEEAAQMTAGGLWEEQEQASPSASLAEMPEDLESEQPVLQPKTYSMDEFLPAEPLRRPEPTQPDQGDPYLSGITPPSIIDSRTKPSSGFSVFLPTPAVEEEPSIPIKPYEETPPTPVLPVEEDNVIDAFDPQEFDAFLSDIQADLPPEKS